MCLPHTGFDMGNMAGVLQEAEVCYQCDEFTQIVQHIEVSCIHSTPVGSVLVMCF
jgi:hypothetical protein